MTVAALAMDRGKGGDELIVGAESGHVFLAPALHKQAAKGGGAATAQPVRCCVCLFVWFY